MQEFAGKHLFVAGGSSGINLAIATAFAQSGARVSILSRNPDKIEAAVQQLRAAGAAAVSGFAADVRQYDAVACALEQAAAAHGPIDVLISGAAGNFLAAAADLSANGFRTVMEIDLQGTFNVLRAAWPHLRKPGAAVLNISAAQSWLPMPMQVHVCAAKAGIDQITRTTALEWGPSGVRVNSIAPGPIAGTEGMARLAPNAASVQAWTEAVPLQRFGTLQDIAQAAMWMCSSQASYINGVVLPVDGGLALGGSSAIATAMRTPTA